MTSSAPAPAIRPATAEDVDQLMELGARSLGWAADARDRDFFLWKHVENPFGASPAWVAEDDGRIVAFRTFMRWSLAKPATSAPLTMARAVDTATDPAYQGRGLFRSLTLHAVDELAAGGYDAVFNTPNTKSRPGYLKMGWHELGPPTLGVQPAGLGRLPKLRQARVAAQKWSEPCTVGMSAADAFSTADGVTPPAGASGWSTPRTIDYLRWRYGFGPLHYRAVEAGGGLMVFRVRRRGPAREVAVVEWLAPRPDPRAVRRLVREVGDYAVAIGLGLRHGFMPVPRLGPIVTWRPVNRAEVPRLADLALSLGDLELF